MERFPAKQEHKEASWARSLGSALDDLYNEMHKEGKWNIVENPREYRITKSITPRELERLPMLPFEVLLSDHHAGLTLITGQKGEAIPKVDGKKDVHTVSRTHEEARFTLHNHLSRHPNGRANPSPQDVRFSYVNNSDIDLIAGEQGLAIYKTNKLLTFVFAGMKTGRARNDKDTQRQIKSGVLKDVLKWGDPRIATVCDYMNGNITWDECEKSIGASVL